MAEETSTMQARLQSAATLFYDRLPPPVRQQLVQTFRSMDENGDGRISLGELIHWARATAASPSSSSSSSNHPSATTSCFEAAMPVIFAFVDADGSGTLDFSECKALFFISCNSSRTCDGCGKLMLESAFTCVDCSKNLSADSNTFDLCSSCYPKFMNQPRALPLTRSSSSAAKSNYLNHPHRNMAAQQSELSDAMDDLFDQVQCGVCKEYHRSTSAGVFIKRHVLIDKGPQDLPVCEWCIACLCSACGNHFQGLRKTASPHRWARQGSHKCNLCKQKRSTSSSVSSATSPSPEDILKRVGKSSIFAECSTCNAKAKNGSLVTPILHTQPPPQADPTAFGSPNQQYGHNVRPERSDTMPKTVNKGHNVRPEHSHTMPKTVNKGIFGRTPNNNVGQMPFYNGMGSHSFHGSPYHAPNYGHPMQGAYAGGGYGNNFHAFPQMAPAPAPIWVQGGVQPNSGQSGGFGVLNMVNNLAGSSPLEMLHLMGTVGTAIEMIGLVSACSIM
ncbi:hypothetical protein L7F22_033083 [Adiantum nelumboides]|nr:hypothetical protein [Adiantum nelumboides]